MAHPGELQQAGVTTSRQVRKKECFLCAGKGRVAEECLDAACSDCQGLGWVLNPAGDEAVCSTCNGNGRVMRVTDAACGYCSGKGYVVKIVEVRSGRSQCAACSGKGVVTVEKFRIECPQCNGRLWVNTSQTDIKLCPTCCGEGEITVAEERERECDACNGTGVIDREQEVDVTPPPQTEIDRLYRLEEGNRHVWTHAEWIAQAAAYGRLARTTDEKRCLEMAERVARQAVA